MWPIGGLEEEEGVPPLPDHKNDKFYRVQNSAIKHYFFDSPMVIHTAEQKQI
jgi:hypothetical protein